ncbi:MAG: YlxM family DNA-binding protein [Ruminococcus sp.]|nr:YlxM family DNA-binding protein [Ruminococcus sp.]
MAKQLQFVMLLDCYGALLTQHQRNVMELYYCEDLSLAEIGQPLGITRQGVRAMIKRTEAILLNYEEKLGAAEKTAGLRECFQRISQAAQSIPDEELRRIINEQTEKGRELL